MSTLQPEDQAEKARRFAALQEMIDRLKNMDGIIFSKQGHEMYILHETIIDGVRYAAHASVIPMTAKQFEKNSRDPVIDSSIEAYLEEESVRRWFLQEGGQATDIFKEAVIHGHNPLDSSEFIDYLDKHGVEYRGLFGVDVPTLILGREGWDEETVKQQLDLRTRKSIRVYSQEMVFAFLKYGKDPLDGDESLLGHFAMNHPGLEFLRGIGFSWPSTESFPGVHSLSETNWQEESPLKRMGYSVGVSGKPRDERRHILKEAFERPQLPHTGPLSYMRKWGAPRSEVRLHQMAESIASYARNMKRRVNAANYAQAISDWEDDLGWLRSEFYTGRFSFQWPDTFIYP